MNKQERKEKIRGIIEAYLPASVAPVMALCDVESDYGRDERRNTTVTLWSDDDEFCVAQRACKDARLIEEEDDRERWEFDIPAQFCGILQMGKLAGVDVGFRRRGFRGWDTTDHLMGDYEAAVRAFGNYMKRYEARHDWDPYWLAVLWKGGPGFAKLARAEGMDAAIAKWPGSDPTEYLERFDIALAEVNQCQS